MRCSHYRSTGREKEESKEERKRTRTKSKRDVRESEGVSWKAPPLLILLIVILIIAYVVVGFVKGSVCWVPS